MKPSSYIRYHQTRVPAFFNSFKYTLKWKLALMEYSSCLLKLFSSASGSFKATLILLAISFGLRERERPSYGVAHNEEQCERLGSHSSLWRLHSLSWKASLVSAPVSGQPLIISVSLPLIHERRFYLRNFLEQPSPLVLSNQTTSLPYRLSLYPLKPSFRLWKRLTMDVLFYGS